MSRYTNFRGASNNPTKLPTCISYGGRYTYTNRYNQAVTGDFVSPIESRIGIKLILLHREGASVAVEASRCSSTPNASITDSVLPIPTPPSGRQ
ncbi:hypothetical protein BDZ89DRAFT_1152176 [Hymenopellis radicata]|nr:hypothetical protein BDZ89DRAFT_1152176 [Hymenopellis radicata]